MFSLILKNKINKERVNLDKFFGYRCSKDIVMVGVTPNVYMNKADGKTIIIIIQNRLRKK
jgi:hypothetical protein